MTKVITIGEIMLRLQPEGYRRFAQAKGFDAFFGGAEANVAVSLAQFGINASFCTKLPENDIADACITELRGLGVDTTYIARGGERMGLYFSEKGASQRASKVIYDRANSAVTTLTSADVNVEEMLSGAEWLHFTGITPAISDVTAAFLEEVLQAAKAKNIYVSCDLNYRKKLWSTEKARKVMGGLMQYVDLLISNEEDAKDVFGIEAENSSITGGALSVDGYAKVADKIEKQYGVHTVAFTLRESISATVNNWSGVLVEGGKAYASRKYTLNVVDRVGGGDSFGAGLIYARLNGYSGQQAIDFAVAASALKHSIEGDYNLVKLDDVLKLASGDGSGRVVR